MRLKDSVSLKGIQPQLCVGISIVNSILKDVYGIYTTITSVNDSTHGSGSLHYAGRAADWRTHDWPTDLNKPKVVLAVASALGPEWDVLLEDAGEDNEHMHIEWDPK